MNIFSTDDNPIQSAMNLDDLRVNKMILESAALLANAIAFHGGPQSSLPIAKTSGQPFRTTSWQNHPSCLWVKQSSGNYDWLFMHTIGLMEQMQMRRGTIHSMIKNVPLLQDGVKYITPGPRTPFANCTPYKSISDSIEAYRLCMVYKWEHDGRAPIWTKCERPDWYSPEYIDKARLTACEFPWTGLRQFKSKR